MEPNEKRGAGTVGRSCRQVEFRALGAGSRPQALGPFSRTGFLLLGGCLALETQKLSPIRTEVVGKTHTWTFKFKK